MKNTFLSRFTPSSMGSETLEAIFVQRHQLVEDLIEVIRESALTANKHFRLLIGGRGLGKTYTISIIYHRLSKIDDLNDKLLIAWLREEEWGISSFLDLLIRIFRALEIKYPEEYKAKLEQEIQLLYQMEQSDAENRAAQLLREFVDKRTLLLLMENLDDIFNGLGDLGQKQFRAYLQNYSFITILATTQRLFHGVKQKNSPFYGFFYPQYLEQLELDEVVDLLKRIAKLEEKKDLENFIESPTGRDRIKAIHYLAGGNHRVYVIFAEFLTRQSLDELVEPFMQTLDELTPYYQARMQWLSPQQRKIVDFLCDRRHPVTVKEIASYCFISHQTASSQLKDLRTKSYVKVEEIGRESFYDLQEILMRFCLEVKKQKDKPIKLIIEFLRCWYTRDELQIRLKKLNREVHKLISDRAFEDCLSKPKDSYTLEKQYIELALEKKEKEQDPRIKAYWLEYKNCLETTKSSQNIENALNYLEKLIAFNDDDSLVWRQKGVCLHNLERYEEAIASYDRALKTNSKYYFAWVDRGLAFEKLDKYEEVVASYDRALEIKSDRYEVWNNRGTALGKLGKHEEAVASFDRAIKIERDQDKAWYNRGISLSNLGRHEEALSSFDRTIEINPEKDLAWHNRGVALSDLGRYEEALASFERTIEINPENELAWHNRGIALGDLGRHEEALAIFERTIEINAENESAWYNRGIALSNLGKYKEAIASFDRAIELNNKDTSIFFNRTIALLGLNRWDEAIVSLKNALDLLTDDKKTASEDIELITSNLFNYHIHNQKVGKNRIKTILKIFNDYKLSSALSQGIVKNIPDLMSEMVSDKAAQIWLETWQELTNNRSEFQIPLRFLNTAVRYKQTKGDRRVLLKLPMEERNLLEPLLKPEQS
jgi:tetratricopeptide (TPR) repeat protein